MNNVIDQNVLMEKWEPLLSAEEAGVIKDPTRKAVTAVVLENTERALEQERGQAQYLSEAAPANATNAGANPMANWDPVLISLVRRSMPNLMAYDVAGVQPMTGPTGLIFAMKSRYTTQNGTEALFNEANASFSGNNAAGNAVGGAAAQSGNSSSLDPAFTDTTPDDGTLDADPVTGFQQGTGMTTAAAEALGDGTAGNDFAEMAFSIEKTSVTAKSRALKAEYTMELAQDLKAVHGLDAETELANILSAEILAEINRELIWTINSRAVLGAQDVSGATGAGTGVAGVFDLDVDGDGRWFAEKVKGLVYQMTKEANQIGIATRRGSGNFAIVSSNVAAALSASGMLDYNADSFNALNSDVTANTFAGNLGRMKIYLDPYATVNYINVGYKGTNPYDAGLFYCPYVPLTMVRAVGENSFQPKIGFKTRYGMVANPFNDQTGEIGAVRTNTYYRIFGVNNL